MQTDFSLDELTELEIIKNSPLVREGDGTVKPLYIYYHNLMSLLERNKDQPKYREHLDELVSDTIAVNTPANLRADRYCASRSMPLSTFRSLTIEQRAELLALDILRSMQEIVDKSYNIQQRNRNKKPTKTNKR